MFIYSFAPIINCFTIPFQNFSLEQFQIIWKYHKTNMNKDLYNIAEASLGKNLQGNPDDYPSKLVICDFNLFILRQVRARLKKKFCEHNVYRLTFSGIA